MTNIEDQYHFGGFDPVSYTQIPDVFFDELMVHLTEAELRVCLYIMRRTFGFKKTTDDISLSQMVNGITTKDGRVLDIGAGVQRAAASRAVKGLEAKGIITAARNMSTERGYETTTYSLRFRSPVDPKETTPSIPKRPGGSLPKILALVSERDQQETVVQNTVLQETDVNITYTTRREKQNVDNSGKPVTKQQPQSIQGILEHRRMGAGEDVLHMGGDGRVVRPVSGTGLDSATARGVDDPRNLFSSETPILDAAVEEAGQRFGDKTPASSKTRARNLMAKTGLDEGQLAQVLYQALALTKDTVSYKGGVKNRMGYFFGTVEQLAADRHKEPSDGPARDPFLGKWADRYQH